jgi:hypothetical protein
LEKAAARVAGAMLLFHAPGEYIQAMKKAMLVSTIAALMAAGCGESSKPGSGAATNQTGELNPLTAPVDYLGAVGKAKQTAVKTVDVASINQAIQMFHVEHGRFPKSLDELVEEKFLPRIPDAPYGMKIEYDAQTGKVRVVKQ